MAARLHTFKASSEEEAEAAEKIYKCNEKLMNPTEALKKDAAWAEAYPDKTQDPREKIPDPKAQVIQKSWDQYE